MSLSDYHRKRNAIEHHKRLVESYGKPTNEKPLRLTSKWFDSPQFRVHLITYMLDDQHVRFPICQVEQLLSKETDAWALNPLEVLIALADAHACRFCIDIFKRRRAETQRSGR